MHRKILIEPTGRMSLFSRSTDTDSCLEDKALSTDIIEDEVFILHFVILTNVYLLDKIGCNNMISNTMTN